MMPPLVGGVTDTGRKGANDGVATWSVEVFSKIKAVSAGLMVGGTSPAETEPAERGGVSSL